MNVGACSGLLLGMEITQAVKQGWGHHATVYGSIHRPWVPVINIPSTLDGNRPGSE